MHQQIHRIEKHFPNIKPFRFSNAEATVAQPLNQGTPANHGVIDWRCPFLVLFWACKKEHNIQKASRKMKRLHLLFTEKAIKIKRLQRKKMPLRISNAEATVAQPLNQCSFRQSGRNRLVGSFFVTFLEKQKSKHEITGILFKCSLKIITQ